MMRLVVLLAALAVAACQTTPPPPLLSPIEQTRSYGYAERQLGPGQWEVTYVGPVRRTSRFPGPREADEAAARTQVYDLMLWRAAQIAQREGYAGFRVGQSRSNVDTHVEDYGYDPFWGPGWGPWGWDYPGWGFHRRRFYPPPYHHRSTWVYQQARVSADIQLLNDTAPGDYLAQEVIAQARRTYPAAEGVTPVQ